MKYALCLVILLALTSVACTTQQPQVYEIGAALHLTGPAAYWGTSELRGAKMAIADINAHGGINGKQIQLDVQDTQTDFQTTSTTLTYLAQRHSVIIGPTWFSQVAYSVADQYNTTIVSASGGTLPVYSPKVFSLWPSEKNEVVAMQKYFIKDNISRIAIIYSQNDWSQTVFEEFVNTTNITIVTTHSVAPDETDFRTILANIDEQDVDAIYGIFAFYPSQGAFSTQVVEKNINIPIYSTSGTENPVLITEFPAVNNTKYVYPVKADAAFIETYMSTYGEYPGPSAAYAYDAIMIIADCLEATDIQTCVAQTNTTGISNPKLLFEHSRIVTKQFETKQVLI